MRKSIIAVLSVAAIALAATGCLAGGRTADTSENAFPSPTAETGMASSVRSETPITQAALPAPTAEESLSAPTVYMTSDISPEGLLAIYDALDREAEGRVAVKISTGEPGSHFLDPNLIKDLVQKVDGTIVESNTAYGGQRASTMYHMQLAEDHGYTAIADVDILDAEGSVSIPVEGGIRLKENLVGANFSHYDFYIILSHFKGHRMGGFGGAIKNMSVGIASSEGKCLIHSAGASRTDRLLTQTPQDSFLEAMTESAKSVSDTLGERIIYINVMNHLSVDCDCIAYGADPTMADIGILASLDPVALDQACVDLVYAAADGADLIERMESRHAIHAIDHAEAIGFGNRQYELVSIDAE